MHRKRGNKSYALNEALETIPDGLVVFFDDDIRVDPNVLVAYSEAATGIDGGAYFGGTVRTDRERPLPAWAEPHFPQSVRGYELGEEMRTAEWYLGFNWAAYKADLLGVGGFNEHVGPGAATGARGQETEMQERLRAAGAEPIDVPEAVVWHFVPEERLTISWLLQRKYAGGKSLGLSQYKTPWEIAKSLIACLITGPRALFTGDRQTALGAACGIAETAGRVVGQRRRRQIESSVPVP
jgi:glycosyltransferase involved in cell wall biosynthesis